LSHDDVSGLVRYTPDGKYAVYERGWRWEFNIKGHEYGEIAVIRLADRRQTVVYGPYKRASWTRGNVLPLTWAHVKETVKPDK
jgi:hypothetical protein